MGKRRQRIFPVFAFTILERISILPGVAEKKNQNKIIVKKGNILGKISPLIASQTIGAMPFNP